MLIRWAFFDSNMVLQTGITVAETVFLGKILENIHKNFFGVMRPKFKRNLCIMFEYFYGNVPPLFVYYER